jgi:UDP-GlcNAc:undecaprenyl-phosphate GlcNAc-1-phosphate transferase
LLEIGMVGLGLAFCLALLGTAIVRRMSGRIGLIDMPGQRKVHDKPIARSGGIAIFWAIGLPMLMGYAGTFFIQVPAIRHLLPAYVDKYVPGVLFDRPLMLILFICTLGVHLLGLIDDKKALSAIPKLAGQLFCAALLVGLGEMVEPGGFRILTVLDRQLPGGFWLSALASILWIVLLTNAFNFMDNMDGLSAGVAIICGSMFFVAALIHHQFFIAGLLLLYIGAAGGFLVFNFPPASIFMGDGGSMVLGFFLSALTIRTTFYSGQGRWYTLFMPLIVTAIPLYDLLVVSLVRLRRGRSPMQGDTNHFSHRLTRHGFSKKGAVLVIYAATLACGLSAPLLALVSSTAAILVGAQTVAILLIIALLERVGEHTQ